MSNKATSASVSRLLDHKLSVTLDNLNKSLKEDDIVEKELMLLRFTKIVNKFYRTMTNPLLEIKEFRKGSFANMDELNLRLKEVQQDLQILYKELNSMESYIVSNFNTLNTEATALRGRLRRVSSKLADFRLHANDNLGGGTYFSDSFQTTDHIDYDEKRYEEDIASIDLGSGTVSLPVKPEKTEQYDIAEISIGSGSNGSKGNNQEIGGLYRGDLGSISDSNADTWFEYERVSDETSTIPLILELKFRLEKDSIINSMSFSSAAFGMRAYPRITKLEVSIDGKEFTDIINQVPSSSYFGEEDSKVIILDPASGKFSGISKLKLPPNKARFINIVLQQDDSFIIKTPSGIKYRKAIGIRDVDLLGEVYEAKGEIVSTNFTANSEIKKVSLVASEQLTENLTSIKHFLSIDDGQNWNEIQSIEKVTKDTTEILNFNIEGVDSIISSNPSSTIRHKALLERSPNGFSTRGGIEKTRKPASDFRAISAGTQNITLSNRPISSTVNLKNVYFGSVGGDEFYLIDSLNTVEREGFKFVQLPLSPFSQDSISLNQEIVKIDGEIWKRVPDISLEVSSSTAYEFDYINNIIKFGDNATGLNPVSSIYFGLEREQVEIAYDSPRNVKLTFDTDGVIETTKVYRLLKSETKSNHLLPKAARINRLNLLDIVDITVITDSANAIVTEKEYVNGSSELENSGDYSIDRGRGIVYTYIETSEEDDTLIDIVHHPRVDVKDLVWTNGDISIPEEEYITEVNKDTIDTAAGTRTIRLSGFVEPRSLRFLSLQDSFKTEVPYKGDGTEFNIGLDPAELSGYYTIDYKTGIIYTYSSVTGILILEYNTSSYFAEYNIAVEIAKDDYSIDEENNK
ncbi:MAG: hypothetical protein DRJ64_07005, partial [Thermoprotei archaeon]